MYKKNDYNAYFKNENNYVAMRVLPSSCLI